ncbi:MAG: hypothetical protein AAGJ81_08545 [Verrucomicrobiota bacterium]
MSKSIRISDDLAARATEAGRLFHRSPPQQIEHWAQIGQVMEASLSYPAQRQIKAVGTEDLDACLRRVGTAEGTAEVHGIISETAGSIESSD